MEPPNLPRILSNYEQTITSFEELNLKGEILRCLHKKGYNFPSTIQSKAILPIIQGKDTIAQGQAGSGKTAAFVISILQKIDPYVKIPQALILVPTRELALQIKDTILSIGEDLRYSVKMCIGGNSVSYEANKLRKNAQIIVGTPGRVADHLSRENINVSQLRLLVLDEADELLGKSFKEKVKEIFQAVPSNIQMVLFFTTMSSKCLESTKNFMREPVVVSTKYRELLSENIKQYYINVESETNRCEILQILLQRTKTLDKNLKYIVYTSQKKSVDFLDCELKEKEFDVISIHGDMDQEERCSLLQKFQTGSHQILIATDSILRGIDIPYATMVISFDTPLNTDHYIQRMGRVGRFGQKGIAVCFVIGNEFSETIRKYCHIELPELPFTLVGVFDSHPEGLNEEDVPVDQENPADVVWNVEETQDCKWECEEDAVWESWE